MIKTKKWAWFFVFLNKTCFIFNSPCLALPETPKDIFLGTFLQEDSQPYYRQGVQQELKNNLDKALTHYFEAARRGHSGSMYSMGKIFEKRKDLTLALKWYMLSFQNKWFNNPQEAHQSSPKKALERLLPGPINSLSLYPNISDDTHKFFRFHALIGFYKNKSAEPYLTQEENILKIENLKRQVTTLLAHKKSVGKIKHARDLYILGYKAYESHSYEQAIFLLSQIPFHPNALNTLGCIYYGNNSFKDYVKAAYFFEQSKTTNSLFNLGLLYEQGHIGQVDPHPDYQKAESCYELSGSSDAYIRMGILYREGRVGSEPNLDQAHDSFEKAQTALGYINIASLYKTNKDFTKPQDNRVETYLKMAMEIEKDHPSKFFYEASYRLGCLYRFDASQTNKQHLSIDYLTKASASPYKDISQKAYEELGYLSEIEKQYKEAIDYYSQSKSDEAFYRIGYIYEHGFYGEQSKDQPNYNKALEFYNYSHSYLSRIATLGLYQLYFDDKGLEIEKTLNAIYELLPSLTYQQQAHCIGKINFYLGDFNKSCENLELFEAYQNQEKHDEAILFGFFKNLNTQLNKKYKPKIKKLSAKEKNILRQNQQIEKALHAKKRFLEKYAPSEERREKTDLMLTLFYKKPNGHCPLETWLENIGKKDSSHGHRIKNHIDKLEEKRGTIKSIKSYQNILELKIKNGGFRVYFSRVLPSAYLLLVGGDKSTQSVDIKKAHKYLTDYRAREQS